MARNSAESGEVDGLTPVSEIAGEDGKGVIPVGGCRAQECFQVAG